MASECTEINSVGAGVIIFYRHYAKLRNWMFLFEEYSNIGVSWLFC